MKKKPRRRNPLNSIAFLKLLSFNLAASSSPTFVADFFYEEFNKGEEECSPRDIKTTKMRFFSVGVEGSGGPIDFIYLHCFIKLSDDEQ